MTDDDDMSPLYETIGAALDKQPMNVVLRVLSTLLKASIESYPKEGREELIKMIADYLAEE